MSRVIVQRAQRKSPFLSRTSEAKIDRRSIKIVMELSRARPANLWRRVVIYRRRLIDRINNSLHARELLIRRE